MALGYAATLRNAQLNQITAAIDAGSGAGKVRIYSGTRPATGGTATTLLAELPLSDPCAPAASGGALTFNAVTSDAAADATGLASWARILDSANTFVMDLTVGDAGELNLDNENIVAGGVVSITSIVITAGNA